MQLSLPRLLLRGRPLPGARVRVLALLENTPFSYAFLDSKHALFHLYWDVGTLYENMLEASSYGPCQAP
jgi:hypothetical protein